MTTTTLPKAHDLSIDYCDVDAPNVLEEEDTRLCYVDETDERLHYFLTTRNDFKGGVNDFDHRQTLTDFWTDGDYDWQCFEETDLPLDCRSI